MSALGILWLLVKVCFGVGHVVCGRRLRDAMPRWISLVFRGAGIVIVVSALFSGVGLWFETPSYRELAGPVDLIEKGLRAVSGMLSVMVCIALLQMPRYLRDLEERIAMFEESR